jgi:hypothetical protein
MPDDVGRDAAISTAALTNLLSWSVISKNGVVLSRGGYTLVRRVVIGMLWTLWPCHTNNGRAGNNAIRHHRASAPSQSGARA